MTRRRPERSPSREEHELPATDVAVDYDPQIPEQPLGIGILGCGWIARDAHLPGYAKYGLPVRGVFDIDPAAMADAQSRFGVPAYASADELLADPEVQVVDVAARTEDRFPLVQQALRAGKHVLSQKPFANDLDEAEAIVALAEDVGRIVAVNQNGRWAPAWRTATLWREQGRIGDVVTVSHAFETSFAWTRERHFNDQAHFVVYDYAAHWFDITRCWLAGKHVEQVRAWDSRGAAQPAEAKTPWNMFAEVRCSDGATATIQGTGSASPDVAPVHNFALVGTAGTIRGHVLDEDVVELHTAARSTRIVPRTTWFPDGFAGTMAELQNAIIDGREPFNSGRHVLASLAFGHAAVESAEDGGRPVRLDIDL